MLDADPTKPDLGGWLGHRVDAANLTPTPTPTPTPIPTPTPTPTPTPPQVFAPFAPLNPLHHSPYAKPAWDAATGEYLVRGRKWWLPLTLTKPTPNPIPN